MSSRRYSGDGGEGRRRTATGGFCKRCGRARRDHLRITEQSRTSVCPIEFTYEDREGDRVEPHPADIITFGYQRTRRNRAAWVHVDRLA